MVYVNIDINVEKVTEEKDKLNALLTRLKEIENNSINKTNLLKDYWQSKTSERFYEEFETYRKGFDKYLEECKGLVTYLQDVVANGYKEYDESTYKVIDEEFLNN